MKKFIKTLLIILLSLAVIDIGALVGLHAWASSTEDEVAHVVENAFQSLNKPANNKKVREFKEMMGGVACGVCHPQNDSYNVNLLKEANISWVRFDIPSEAPYLIDENGKAIKDSSGNYQLKQSYINYKNRCMIFKNQGLKVMGITPYVDDMLNEVGDLETFRVGGEYSENFISMVKEVSKFYAADLIGVVDCFQISNELTIDKWMGALTMDQICYYQGELQMKEMYPITHEAGIPIGFNLCGYTLYHYPKQMCDTYGEYFDYVGLDLYLGCFEDTYHTTLIYDLLLRHLYNLSGCKPVMINEFGYISAGQPKNEAERAQFLKDTYGDEFDSEEKIRNNIVAFLDKFDEVTDESSGSPMTTEARRIIAANGGESNTQAKEAAANYILGKEQIAHIYKALPDGYYLSNYEHNPEGQAKFYKDTINRLRMLPFVCGYFAYCYGDSDECYQCGGEACPVETGWGLVSLGESKGGSTPYDSTKTTLKPAYYAIQEVFGKIQRKNRKYEK